MTAEEMFEKLGYKKTQDNKNYIEYNNRKKRGEDHITVEFNLKKKTFSSTYWDFYYDTHYENDITLDLLDAINKQVEELKESGKW